MIKILIVDDSKFKRKSLENLLKKSGFQVVSVASAELLISSESIALAKKRTAQNLLFLPIVLLQHGKQGIIPTAKACILSHRCIDRLQIKYQNSFLQHLQHF